VQAWLSQHLTPGLASELSLFLAPFLLPSGAQRDRWFHGTDPAQRLRELVSSCVCALFEGGWEGGEGGSCWGGAVWGGAVWGEVFGGRAN
jgi:hypothetical protein